MRRLSFLAVAAFVLAAILAAGLAGCQQLFTTSLGTSLARDSLPIPSDLSASAAADLAAQAKANEDEKLAGALVSSLVDQIASETDPGTKVKLESSAASAAVVASGIGSVLTDPDLIDAFTSGADIDLNSLLATIQDGATADVITALSFLDSSVIADPAATGLEATDYAFAAIVIAASAIPSGTDLETFDPATDVLPADQAKFDVAKDVLLQAVSLVEPGSQSADLLDQLKAQFQL